MAELFFDTETSGLPPRDTTWREHPQQFPEVCSIAWKYKDKENYFIIQHKKLIVPNVATAVHGITTKMVRDSPHTFDKVMELFIADCTACKRVVGFNTYFDTSIVQAATIRHLNQHSPRLQAGLKHTKRIDVMKVAAKMFYNRWPSLVKLHKYLFNEDFEAHNALADVLALERCYTRMVELGKINKL